jgi:hypothetical protein
VSAEEVVKCEEQYEKGRAVDSILMQVAKRRNVAPESLYEAIAWPLHKKYGHSYEAFKLSIQEPEQVFGDLEIEPETLAELKHTIARRLTPKPVKVRADIEVKCFDYQGIEAIRRALKAGEALSTEEVPIKVRLVAPPLYVMSTTSTDKTAAIDTMEKAVAAIQASIESEKGDLVVKMAVSRADCEDNRVLVLTFSAQGRLRDGRRRAQGPHGAVRAGQHGRCRRRRRRGRRGRRVKRRESRTVAGSLDFFSLLRSTSIGFICHHASTVAPTRRGQKSRAEQQSKQA